jgi:hypothetical protein
MQSPLRNRLQPDGIMLVELWKSVVLEGLVEYGFSGRFATPVFLIPTGTEFAGHSTSIGSGSHLESSFRDRSVPKRPNKLSTRCNHVI